ncbi:hypothetical protein [Amycolatopsis sp. PS_44_ISF1]|uniref:hypothetical protein n=1 Tax=Amycolatopsis sp. PS_44_ISF1 TaxID=2974917 RepID=UPI0028DED1AC|nr:hypothetical protein [Amycolatopsis sp. PS_44_ISF1]MDT8913538.1 hypothetical protein [Amycolatopsis sp. PS_44_ISF1]
MDADNVTGKPRQEAARSGGVAVTLSITLSGTATRLVTLATTVLIGLTTWYRL